MKLLTVILMFIGTYLSFGQVAPKNDASLINYRKSRYNPPSNFNGPVKQAKFKVTHMKKVDTLKNLPQSEIFRYSIPDVLGLAMIQFDTLGLPISVQGGYGGGLDTTQRYFTPILYQYEQSDFLIKTKVAPEVHTGYGNAYPAYDNYFKIKPNLYRDKKNTFYKPENGIDYREDSIHRVIHKQTYTFNIDKFIKEEVFYTCMDDLPSLRKNTIYNLAEFDREYKFIYEYDEHKNVIKQNIVSNFKASIYNKELENYGNIPFHAMGTESRFCEDLHFSYQYDQNNRMIQMVFFGCGDTLASEKYSYHPTEHYINNVRKFLGGVGGDFQVTKTIDYIYDPYGNIIQRDFIKGPYQTGLKFPIPTTYYKYEYDEYHNWVKAFIFLEGKDKEPSIILDRTIEYY